MCSGCFEISELGFVSQWAGAKVWRWGEQSAGVRSRAGPDGGGEWGR